MSRKPSYPADAPVAAPASAQATGSEDELRGAGKTSDSRRRKQLMTGAAIGIGSAAIVAALLYANRGRRTDRS